MLMNFDALDNALSFLLAFEHKDMIMKSKITVTFYSEQFFRRTCFDT